MAIFEVYEYSWESPSAGVSLLIPWGQLKIYIGSYELNFGWISMKFWHEV